MSDLDDDIRRVYNFIELSPDALAEACLHAPLSSELTRVWSFTNQILILVQDVAITLLFYSSGVGFKITVSNVGALARFLWAKCAFKSLCFQEVNSLEFRCFIEESYRQFRLAHDHLVWILYCVTKLLLEFLQGRLSNLKRDRFAVREPINWQVLVT